MDTELVRVLTYCERLPPLKPQDPLITWVRWNHFAIWKFYISIFTRLMTTKLGRLLTLGEGLKCKHLSCHRLAFSFNTKGFAIVILVFHFLLSPFLNRLAKFIFKFFSNCCLKRLWPGSELWIWYVVCFQVMSFRDKQLRWIETRASGIYLFGN